MSEYHALHHIDVIWNMVIIVVYIWFGLRIAPHILGVVRIAGIGMFAFFLGCAGTHCIMLYLMTTDPTLFSGTLGWVMLVMDTPQAVGGAIAALAIELKAVTVDLRVTDRQEDVRR